METVTDIRTLFDASSSNVDLQKQVSTLYQACKNKFTAYICKIHPDIDRQTADEIYHDSFIAMYRQVREGKLVELTCSMETYLISIGKNIALKHGADLRKRQEQVFTGDFPEIAEVGETDETWHKKQEIARRLVSEMKNPCREVLFLFYWQRKSMREIAQAMNYRDEDSAKSRKAKCMKQLKTMMINTFKKEGLN